MPSQQPFNPYAQTSSRAPPPDDLRERVAVLETQLPHLAAEAIEAKRQSDTSWQRILSIEAAGAAAIREMPALIEAALSPLQVRLLKLEARWWEPLRPHLGKVYIGAIMLAFAWGWKRVTGEPVPVRVWIEVILKSFG